MSLQRTIQDYRQQQADAISPTVLEALSRSASLTQQEIQQKELVKHALRIGDHFPDFTLNASDDEPCSLDTLLQSGPLIVSFYRGGWCPYCILELKALSDIVNLLPRLNATLVAVSPEITRHASQTKQENHLNFSLLRDDANQLAEACGLAFTLSEELLDQYHKFGLNLTARNDDEHNRLPIPATFVLDQKGIVRYAFVEDDFMSRAEPGDILTVLKEMN